ncbi:MAG: hypothetical protein Q9167_007175 [Letrouitia subvulpina]
MARLNKCHDSEEELPDLSALFAKCNVAENDENKAPTLLRPLSTKSKTLDGGRQRERKPLKIAHVNSLLLPIADSLGNNISGFGSRIPAVAVDTEGGGSQYYNKHTFGQFRSPDEKDTSETKLKDDVATLQSFCGGNMTQPYEDLKGNTENTNKSRQYFQCDDQWRDSNLSEPTSPNSTAFDFQVSRLNINGENSIFGNVTEQTTPPRPAIRVKSSKSATSFSKPKLKTPTKRDRIPPSPYRPSVDAFWSQEAIDDWNLQYTPKKPPKSPSKVTPHRLKEGCKDYELPYKQYLSMEKKPSPKKQVLERQRAFNITRQDLATIFLRELDDTVTGGQVASLAASTGGIKICWSKTLQSTAGRANWRREHVRAKDPNRLVNVLAHEFCHLATFMISEVKDRPHGKEFKDWARKCSRAFSCRNVNVTTKHNYDITYKYLWACTSCGTEFKRHSKSIDPTKQSCGICKSKLVQVKPAGRTTGGALNGYQTFVKENYANVKKSNPEMAMGEVMAALGRDFREMRSRINNADGKETKVASDATPEEGEPEHSDGAACIDSALDKLDSLTLNS